MSAAPVCLQGGEDCDPAIRPDPRFPRLEDGDAVLCEECYQAALDEIEEDAEHEAERVRALR